MAMAQNVAVSQTGGFAANPLRDILFTPTVTNCVAKGIATSNPLIFTFTLPTDVTAAEVSWRVQGDFLAVASFPNGVMGTSFQVRTGTGYGKMRVTMDYYTITYLDFGPTQPRPMPPARC